MLKNFVHGLESSKRVARLRKIDNRKEVNGSKFTRISKLSEFDALNLIDR